jgi:hypothetical protein
MEIEFNAGVGTVEVVSMVVGVLLPILVGLVTKAVTSPSTKAILLAALSALSGFLTEFVEVANSGAAFQVDQALLTWLMTFVVAVAVHYGLWKPTGVTAKAQNSLNK